MKFPVLVTALYLASLGISVPTPNLIESGLQAINGTSASMPLSLDINNEDIVKRATHKTSSKTHSSGSTKPKKTKTTKSSTTKPKKTKTKSSSTKPKKTKTKSTSATKKTKSTSGHKKTTTSGTHKTKTTGTKKTKPTGTKKTKPTGTKKTKPTGTKKTKPTSTHKTKTTHSAAACAYKPKGKNGKLSRRGSNCGDEEDTKVYEYGHGWRSPTAAEAKAATPNAPGPNAPGFQYASNKLTKPSASAPQITVNEADCKDWRKLTGFINTPARDHSLFYARVNGQEYEFAKSSGHGFRFLNDAFKKDETTVASLYAWDKKCGMQFWASMSAAYASLVSGDVHVLLEKKFEVGEKPAWPAGSIWEKDEFPTITQVNQKTCRLWRWNYGTKTHDLLAVKTGATAAAHGCTHNYPDKPAAASSKSTSSKSTSSKTKGA